MNARRQVLHFIYIYQRADSDGSLSAACHPRYLVWRRAPRVPESMFVPAIGPPGMPPPVRRTRSHDRSLHSQSPPPPPPPPPPPLPSRQTSLSNEVGIFWDYENVSLPRGVEEAAAAAQRLARLATTLGGRVVELRLYHDSEKPTLHKPHRAALERLGFTIIDCPTSDKKEASTHIPALSLILAPIPSTRALRPILRPSLRLRRRRRRRRSRSRRLCLADAF